MLKNILFNLIKFFTFKPINQLAQLPVYQIRQAKTLLYELYWGMVFGNSIYLTDLN